MLPLIDAWMIQDGRPVPGLHGDVGSFGYE